MSAYWRALGQVANRDTIELTWADRRSPQYRCSVSSGENVTEQVDFTDQAAVDAWARERGVDCWRVIEMVRCFPEASTLPMDFPNAPDRMVLLESLTKLRGGAKLGDVAKELGVSAMLLRAWLKGVAPLESTVPSLRTRR
jgi:hypothetical protein